LEACLNEDPGLRPSAAALVAELLGVEENEPGLLDRGAAAADDPTTPAFPAVPVAAAPVPTLQVPRAEAVETAEEPPADTADGRITVRDTAAPPLPPPPPVLPERSGVRSEERRRGSGGRRRA